MANPLGKIIDFFALLFRAEEIRKIQEQFTDSGIKLECPYCGFQGFMSIKKQDFKILGKDKEYYILLKCPKCRGGGIRWDTVTNMALK